MAGALEQFIKQIEDSGVIAAGKLENFIPPNAQPKDAQELAGQLVQSKQLTKFQAQEIYQGRARSLILGNYTILDKIGAGGMGQVFKAEHRRMHRIVAIKTLPRAMMSDAATIARFEREVTAAARLRHPNIVAADDADEAAGSHFLVMEYIEGSDLSVLVKKNGPLALATAVNYVLQAARGLEYAHGEGVIHRDIKPANLLLDKKGTVKILDMGLARIHTGGDTAAQAELTGTGAVMGTVDYMAPEQALGTRHAKAPSDIYSLGCTLYYLVAGKPIYDGETLMAKLIGHREEPIPSLAPGAPAPVQAVFERMVAKQLDDRYGSMTEVVAALESCLAGLATDGSWASVAASSAGSDSLSVVKKSATTARAADRTAVYVAPAQASAAGLSRRRKLAIGVGILALALVACLIIVLKGNDPGPVVADQEPPALSQTPMVPAAAPTTGAPERGERQFVDLFNGRDLTGWYPVGDPALWQVDASEGVLTATGAGEGWLINTRDVGDFIVRLEYQHGPGADSGLALFVVHPLDSEFLKVQIGNIPGHATGGFWSNPTNHASGGFLRAARPAQEKPAVQWNQLEMELRERRLTVSLNGSEVSRFDLEQLAKEPDAFQPISRATGRIALRSQAGPVRFRKVQMATAPANEPITTYTTAAFKGWEAQVAAMPAEDQVKAVLLKLLELNPGFDGEEKHAVEGGMVTKFYFDTDQVSDLSPLRAFTNLGLLHCPGSGTHAGKLADLSPLQGMRIGHLYCMNTQISDLSSLVGMPLTILCCERTQISDLKPLEGMKLTKFSCWLTPVSDLSPLRGMPLAELGCFGTPVSDLSPLAGMKLTTLNTCWTAVSDLSPLAGMPLTRLHVNGTLVSDLTPIRGMNLSDAWLTPQNIKKGIGHLRKMTSLKMIAVGGAKDEEFVPAEFWKKYDAGDFGKPVATSTEP